jgi:5-formyltetrahydrofolate cyclo-ligase
VRTTCVYGEGVPGLQEEKAVLRAHLLAARSALSAEQRTAAARAIRDALLDRPEVQMAGTVAAYYSVGAEPDTRGLVYALWKRGNYVLLPVLRADGDLDWASYEGPDSLVPGPRGLLEPGEPPRGTEAVARADAVLVPALAVDRAGNRLGRGGGSYDRALARVGPLIPLIALVYDGELLDHVPAERHDVPVRATVSPLTGITVLARGDDPHRPPAVSSGGTHPPGPLFGGTSYPPEPSREGPHPPDPPGGIPGPPARLCLAVGGPEC